MLALSGHLQVPAGALLSLQTPLLTWSTEVSHLSAEILHLILSLQELQYPGQIQHLSRLPNFHLHRQNQASPHLNPLRIRMDEGNK